MNIDQLAKRLSSAVPLLHGVLVTTEDTWRRIILAAGAGSDPHRELLTGNVYSACALAIVDDLREAREHGHARGHHAASTAPIANATVTGDADGGQPLAPTRPVGVWTGPDVALSPSDLHSQTVRPSIAAHEVAS